MRKERKNTSQWRTGRLVAKALVLFGMILCATLLLQNRVNANESQRSVYIDENGYAASVGTITTSRSSCQHQPVTFVQTQPTCGKAGLEVTQCQLTNCKEILSTKVIPATGKHSYTVTDQKGATCGVDGYKKEKCSVCGDIKTTTYKATGQHSYSWVDTVQPGCTTPGRREDKCSTCGHVREVKEIPGGHNFTVSFGEKAATCGEDGYKTMKCSRCTATSTVVYKATGLHNYEWVTALEPGCTTAGRNEEKCSVCGNVKRVVEIPGGHNYTVSAGEKAATCGADGYKKMKCSRCEDIQTTTIPKTNNHSYRWVNTIEETCTKGGHRKYECSVCGDIREEENTPPKSHYFEFDHVKTPATCSKKGVSIHVCTYGCGTTCEKTDIAIDPNAHDFIWSKTSEPTSSAPGQEKHICKLCEYVESTRALYLVSFNANNGTGAPTAQIKTHGVDLVLSSTKPTRTGYTFQGWGTSATATTVSYNAGATYKTNKTLNLYAIWKAKAYDTIFDVNGGSGNTPKISAQYGATITIPSYTVTRTGYYFLGWASTTNATVAEYKSGNKLTVSKNRTLYAVWQIRKWTLTFNANGGTGTVPTTRKTDHGKTITIGSCSLTRSGYYFMGWSTSATATTATYTRTSAVVMTKDLTLYAVWKPQKRTFTLSFDINGGKGTLPSSVTVNYGSDAEIGKSSITRDGYYYLGWSEVPNATTATYKKGDRVTLTADLKLYAVWSGKPCKVTFDANGGSGAPPVLNTKVGSSFVLEQYSVKRSHYYFVGWSESRTATTATYKRGSKITLTGDLTLYAVWQVEMITLSFDLNGGNSGKPADIKKAYATVITMSQAYARRCGYYFKGWAKTKNATEADYTSGKQITLLKNMTLYAVWQKDPSGQAGHQFTTGKRPADSLVDKDKYHREQCAVCNQWIETPHKLTVYVGSTYDGQSATGTHYMFCVDSNGYRCGYHDEDFCHNAIKSWTYYTEKIYKYKGQFNDKITYRFFYRFGTCPVCNTKVMEYTSTTSTDIPSKDDIIGGVIEFALGQFPLGKAKAMWDAISTGVSTAELLDMAKQYGLNTNVTEDNSELTKLTYDPDKDSLYQDAVDCLDVNLLHDRVYRVYVFGEGFKKMDDRYNVLD